MLRLKPTVISLTAGEVKDAQTRRRFRRHLREADAQQGLERERMEQNRETPPRGRSSSASIPQVKDGPDSTTRSQPEGGILTSSPPQSPAVPIQHQVTASPGASPQGPDRRASDGQDPEASREPSPSVPRLLAMTPRRLPPALLSVSSLRRGVSHVRIGEASFPPATGFAPRTRRGVAGETTVQSEVAQQTRAPVSPSTVETSPTLPAPFSQTPRQVTVDRPVRRFADVSHISDSEEEDNTKASGIRRFPPATPVRRSSLSATSHRHAASDGQGDASLTNAAEREAEAHHTRTGSRRVQISSRGTNYAARSTRDGSTDDDEAEASTSTPGATGARLQIYNDALPPSAQPETPQNLPEARHQSRLRGSYTVPARRDLSLDIPTPTTSRRRRTRSGLNQSPTGLQTPGFLGLYGGLENSDEVQVFEHAERELEARLSRTEQSSSFEF